MMAPTQGSGLQPLQVVWKGETFDVPYEEVTPEEEFTSGAEMTSDEAAS